MINTPCQYLKGVGPKRSEALKRLGLNTIEDMLHYFPRRYEDRTHMISIRDVKIGEFHTIKGEVLTFDVKRTKRGLTIFTLFVGDRTGRIACVWFNQPYLKNYFKVGEEVIVYGKVELYKTLQMNSPDYELISEEGDENVHTSRIVPIYSLTADITQRKLRSVMKIAVDTYARLAAERMPRDLLRKYKLPDIKTAINGMHFPVNFEHQKRSRQRFVFEEFFLMELAIFLKKYARSQNSIGIAHKLDTSAPDEFKALLPFELTQAQKKVMDEIASDMSEEAPMNRLLQGDVGSGKTVVALYALMICARNNFQGAFLAPTEVLAKQHYLNSMRLLSQLGLDVGLLIGSMTQAEKESVIAKIKEGSIDIVIGTHALIEEGVEFSKLGLVVIDEQHKFGVMQRSFMRGKGADPDVLIMTATPIPRTLALTLYGDLSVSTLGELPPNRKIVKTYWVGEHMRERVYNFIRKEAEAGHQVYVVYPIIEESEALELKSAVSMYEEFSERVFKGLKVGLLHGRMDADEKDAVMASFKKGKLDILVSTQVIEVGIDVANASVMVIEHAERFGLSQLHQLRGRVGRGKAESYCILLSNPNTDEARERLSTMAQTTDGFKIAEKDLEIRGQGEIFGIRQSGLPDFNVADVTQDFKVLQLARDEAEAIINNDPQLKKPENALLKNALKVKFKDKLSLISVG